MVNLFSKREKNKSKIRISKGMNLLAKTWATSQLTNGARFLILGKLSK